MCLALFGWTPRWNLLAQALERRKDEEMEVLYRQWGVWAVVIPSVLPPPTPFKIFVLSAGLFRLSFLKFLLSVAVGRSIRYFMWGILAVLYGELARDFLEQNLPVVGTVLFALFVTAMVSYAIMWLRARRRYPRQERA